MTHLALVARSRQGSGRLADSLFRGSSRVAAWRSSALLILIGVLLLANSRLTWQTFGLGFITGRLGPGRGHLRSLAVHRRDDPRGARSRSILAAPIGILTAIYLSELAPRRLATPLTFMIELLAAIPSVVIGLWGVFILAPFLRGTVEAWIVSVFGWIPFLGGPTYGVGLFTRRGHPHDHDPADDRDHLARGHPGRPGLASARRCSRSARRAGRSSGGRSCRSPGRASSARSSSASAGRSARRWP